LPTLPQLPTFTLPTIAINIPLPKLPFLNIKLPGFTFPPSLPVFSFSLPKIPDLPSLLLPNFYPLGMPTVTVTITIE
jgi:hypothetical protein